MVGGAEDDRTAPGRPPRNATSRFRAVAAAAAIAAMGTPGSQRRLFRRRLCGQPVVEESLGGARRRPALPSGRQDLARCWPDAYGRRNTMSRAYRIRVRESLRKVVRAED